MSKPVKENDPAAYQKAADKVTAESDKEVYVVEKRYDNNQSYRVAGVLTSYSDAQAYMEDLRDFHENCPEDTPEQFGRKQVMFRVSTRQSPNKLYENWPPEEDDD